MATKLEKEVVRETELKIHNRPVIVSMGLRDNVPEFKVRLKGLTSGYYLTVEDMIRWALHKVMRMSDDSRIPVKLEDQWRHDLAGEIPSDPGTSDQAR